MANQNPCRIVPMRVMACVIDPSSIMETVDDATRRRIHKWSFAGPNYGAFDPQRRSPFDKVWPNLFPNVDHGNVFEATSDEKAWPPSITTDGKSFSGRAVCVSWSMPSAWSRPEDPQDPNSLPALPDRWLVFRFARRIGAGVDTTKEAPSVRAWVVDAGVVRAPDDKIKNESSSAVVPVKVKVGKTVKTVLRPKRMGAVRDAENVSNKQPAGARQPLTVRGTQWSPDFTFASFAPANLGNLSLLDPLDKLERDASEYAFSYLVLGWYLKPEENDPLARTRAKEKAAPFRSALGLTGEAQSGERTLLHGMITYVDYFNSSSYQGPAFGSPKSKAAHRDTYVDSTSPVVGFGNTAEEALARLLADVNNAKDANVQLATDTNRLLQGLLLDQVWTWDVPGALELEPRGIKASQFQAIDGGHVWTISAVAKKNGTDDDKNGGVTKLEAADRSALHDLNVKQAALDALRGDIASKSEMLYAAFGRWRREQVKADDALFKALESAINALSTTIGTLRQKEADDAEEITKLANTLRSSLEKSSADKLTLTTVDETPFQIPKEPAVAIANIGASIPKYREALVPRTIDEVAVRRKGSDTNQPDAKWMKLVENAADEALVREALTALAREGALAEQAVAEIIEFHGQDASIDAIAKWRGRSAGVLRDVKNAGIPIAEAPFRGEQCTIELEADAQGKTIPLGQLMLVWTQQPWLPLFLDWEVEWWKNLPENDHSKNEPRIFQGRTVLAHRPQKVVRNRLDALTSKASTGFGPRVQIALRDSRHRLEELLDVEVLAQALSGIHQQLLKRDDAQPRIAPTADDTTFPTIAKHLEGTSLAPPTSGDPSPFQSVRDGTIVVTKLRVVDRFGQAFAWTNPMLAVPKESMRLVMSLGQAQKRGVAVERALLEPHRVAVRPQWAPESRSFIRGFIIPSRLDKSLIIYDADAKPLGVIGIGSGGVQWRNLDKRPTDSAMARFVNRFVDASGNAAHDAEKRFKQILDLFDRALPRTHPSNAHGTSSIAAQVGRPLVLVRAEIALERRGAPIADPASFEFDPNTGHIKAFAANVPIREAEERVLVRIGSRFLPDDGVVGYYLDGRDELIETAKTSENGATPMNLSAAAPGVLVDFIMDPRGRIHLVPDILAATTFRLAPEWYEDSLRRLPAVLRVAPVLFGPGLDFATSWNDATHVDLPIVAPATAQNATATTNPTPSKSTEAAVITARFSVKGMQIPVDPTPPLSMLSQGEVTAAEGLVIVGTGALEAATSKGAS